MADWEDHMQWSHAGMYTDEYFPEVIEALCSTGCRKKRGQKKGGSWGKFSNLFHKCIIQKGYTHLSFILVYLEQGIEQIFKQLFFVSQGNQLLEDPL